MKQFLEFYNHDNGIWGDPASDVETRAVWVAFKETALENLLTIFKKPENCQFSQAKLANPVVFASMYPLMRSTGTKSQEAQCNM